MGLITATIVCVFLASIGSCAEKNGHSAQEFFDSIPTEEQSYFISYALAIEVSQDDVNSITKTNRIITDDSAIIIPDDLNIPEDVMHKFQTMDIPEDFPPDLYAWVRHEYKMSEDGIVELAVRSQYCFPDGHCIELDDVGSTCCPF